MTPAADQTGAFAGRAITLDPSSATGTAHSFASGAAQIQSVAQSDNASGLPSNPVGATTGASTPAALASGTKALIDDGAVITAHSIAVLASQRMTVTVEAGGAGLGGVAAVGVGVALVTVQSDVSALVGAATLTAVGGGALTVSATRTSAVDVLGIEGAVSGVVAFGGAVAVASDTSNVTALLGAEPAGIGTYTGAPLAADGFGAVTVAATQTAAIGLSTFAIAASGSAAAGASVTLATLSPDTLAAIGQNAAIGQGTPVGPISVTAIQVATLGGFPNAAPGFTPGNDIGVGGAASQFLAGTASYADVTLGGTVVAEIGDGAKATSNGAVTVQANGTIDAPTLAVDGGAAAFLAVGAVIGSVTLRPVVRARVGVNASVSGSSIDVESTDDATVSLTVSPAAGGVGGGSGGRVTGTGTVTTTAQVAGATLSSPGAITITASATPSLTVNSQGHDYGGVTVGETDPTVSLTNTTTAEVGGTIGSAATRSIRVLATSVDTSAALGTGTGGAGISIETLTTSGTLVDDTAAKVDANAMVTAAGAIDVESRADLTAASNPTVDADGLGVGVEAESTLTATGNTATSVGDGAQVTGGSVSMLAHLVDAHFGATGRATATSGADSSTATETTTATLSTQLTLGQHDIITGTSGAVFKALQDRVDTTAEADATSNAGAASTTPTAHDRLKDTVGVTAGTLSEVHTRALDVEADAPYTPGVDAIANQNGAALYDSGSASSDGSLTLGRSIDWNAVTYELSAPSPTLVIKSPTDIEATDIGYTLSNGVVTVLPVAYTGALTGSALFRIAGSAFDGQTQVGNVSVKASATFSPVPSIVFSSTYDKITIDNQSSLGLVVGNIDPLNTTATVVGNIVVDVPGVSVTPNPSVVAGPTAISITSEGSPDIDLTGNIRNPLGTTVVTAAAGNVVAGTSQRLSTTTLTVSSATGSVGAAIPTALVATPRALDQMFA